VIEHEVKDYPGLASNPFTWDESVQKFDRLVAGRVDKGLSREIKDAVHSIESIQVRDLMKLLGSIRVASAGAPVQPQAGTFVNAQFPPRAVPSAR
jgi:2-methylcitrate dehydratase